MVFAHRAPLAVQQALHIRGRDVSALRVHLNGFTRAFFTKPVCCAAQTSTPAPDSSPPPPPSPPPAVNKQGADDQLYSYLLSHNREHPILKSLRQETATLFPKAVTMAVSPEQGAFLAWLVGALGARNVLEIGVFTGYSSLAMAMALPQDGRLVACDRDPRAMAVAEEFWKKAGVREKIEPRLGLAAETLQSMLDAGEQETYDFAFIDADKRGYRGYYEALLKLVRPGGVIVVDNVLWYGKVVDMSVDDKTTVALREFNDFVVQDPRVAMSLVPIGDGLTLCRKL